MSELVSICIPVRDGAKWIDATIDSVLAQTYADFELLVVDDGSTDGTLERVRAIDDARVRLVVNRNPQGPAANHSRCVQLSRGTLVKFIHHDDELYPTCVARMADFLATNGTVGLVFCPRDVLLEDSSDREAVRWREKYGVLHSHLEGLEKVNTGSDLIRQYIPALRGPHVDNWIGEPSAVMLRRTCFDRVGLFNSRMRLTYDLEMWLRIAAVFDVGFIDEALVGYRRHRQSWTEVTARTRTDWLDLLWLLEGLLDSPGFEAHRRALKRFRAIELARTSRRQLMRLLRGNWDLVPLGRYLSYRVARSLGRPSPIHF